MTEWLKIPRNFYWNHGDILWAALFVIVVAAAVYMAGPKATPDRMSELLADDWSTTEIYLLYKRLKCDEGTNAPGSQCDLIAKIQIQKKSAKEPSDAQIENDISILPNGEIVKLVFGDGCPMCD